MTTHCWIHWHIMNSTYKCLLQNSTCIQAKAKTAVSSKAEKCQCTLIERDIMIIIHKQYIQTQYKALLFYKPSYMEFMPCVLFHVHIMRASSVNGGYLFFLSTVILCFSHHLIPKRKTQLPQNFDILCLNELPHTAYEGRMYFYFYV